MLHVGTWWWGAKYGRDYVERLFAGLHRHFAQPFTPWVFAPGDEDAHWTEIPGCFARLRAFDPAWQAGKLAEGDRLVIVDLDVVVTGPLDALFDRPEPFVILQGANAANPCPYNGSLWMLRPGYRPDVWGDLTPDAVAAIPRHEFPDDQGWLAAKVPGAAGWRAGPESGVYAFGKPGWPKGSEQLPPDARLVAFPGRRDPSQFTHLSWVQEHWRP